MSVLEENVDVWFPQLRSSGFRRTSEETPNYNCIAWAAGDSGMWWEPRNAPGYYWPARIPRDGTVRSVVLAMRTLGFQECGSGEIEEGFEKIAIYGVDGNYTHAARQLASGKWTSKIGCLDDIEHDHTDGLSGDEYGTVDRYMKRPRQ